MKMREKILNFYKICYKNIKTAPAPEKEYGTGAGSFMKIPVSVYKPVIPEVAADLFSVIFIIPAGCGICLRPLLFVLFPY